MPVGMSWVLAWLDAGLGVAGTWLPSVLLTLFTAFLALKILQARPKNFPPGLTILPVVGSLLSMPRGPTTEVLRGLKKKYGDVASFAIFGTRVVLVSGVGLMKEVFALRSTTGRPDIFAITIRNKFITDGRNADVGVLSTSGPLWQEQRRFLLHHMRDLGFGKTQHEPVMVEEITELMDHLAREEGRALEMRRLFNRSVINILWAMVMGQRFPHGHAKLNKLLQTLIQPADNDFLSPFVHIPYISKIIELVPFQRRQVEGIRDVTNFLKEELKEFLANKELRNGDNFTALYLKEIEKEENPNFNMDQLAGLIFELFFAGMETTSSTLTTAVYLLATHPHVQRRVQEELHAVVGRSRLPSFADMERLPYVQAAIQEVQRFFNLTKFSVPHQAYQDCRLGGYDIPKGTWLLANVDDAHTDHQHWTNPQHFDPHNFLDENGKFEKSDAFLPFGVGRRQCAGMPLAKLELFLFFTHLFQRFTFTLVKEHKPITDTNPLFNSPPEYTVMVHCCPQ